MEINTIKTTDLSLLRKILEGNYDNSCDKSYNCENNDKNERKRANKSQIKKKREKSVKSDNFHLHGDHELIKNWLKEKNKLIRQKRTEKLKEKRKEKEKNEALIEQKKEKLEKARESYDKWLKELRFRNSNKTRKIDAIMEKESSEQRAKAAQQSFINWLEVKRETRLPKRKVRPDVITKASSNETSSLSFKHVTQRSKELSSDKTEISEKKYDKITTENKLDKRKSISETDIIDEEFEKIVRNLRKSKLEEKEKSKKRVNSGILFKREKTKSSIISSSEISDPFQWRLTLEAKYGDEKKEKEETSEFILSDVKSDSRSRRIDKIDHRHENPFIDKSDEYNKTII